MIHAFELKQKGGAWLGAARTWVQENKLNGDSVTWGSEQELRPAFTMREIEDLAAVIAAAAMNEVKPNTPGQGRPEKDCAS